MQDEAVRVKQRPADVFVVSINGMVRLLVDGEQNDVNRSLVDEMRASFVATGTPAADVEVVWQSRRRA